MAAILLLGAGCQHAENIPPAPQAVSGPEPQPELTTAPTTTEEPSSAPEPTTLPPLPTLPPTTAPPRRSPAPTSPATSQYLQPEATTGSDLADIRACESGNNYSTNTGNGYYGAYQFDLETWAAAGGTGNPANASAAEQDARAQAWINSGHRGAWPNC